MFLVGKWGNTCWWRSLISKIGELVMSSPRIEICFWLFDLEATANCLEDCRVSPFKHSRCIYDIAFLLYLCFSGNICDWLWWFKFYFIFLIYFVSCMWCLESQRSVWIFILNFAFIAFASIWKVLILSELERGLIWKRI